jgi:hypothetical protein
VGSIASFHQRLRARPADAFLVVRALAVSLGPDIDERVSSEGVVYARRGRPFLTVVPAKSRLHLMFPRDVPLADPSGRLLRRADERFVAVDGPEAVDGHVQEFVRNSYAALR